LGNAEPACLASVSAYSLAAFPEWPLHHATLTLGWRFSNASSFCQRAASGIALRLALEFGSIRFQPLLRQMAL
jgi:hypothetical protein